MVICSLPLFVNVDAARCFCVCARMMMMIMMMMLGI